MITTISDRERELMAQVEALKADAVRLDWLGKSHTWTHSGDGYYTSEVRIDWGDSIKRRNLREAIDAVMAVQS